MKTLYLIGGTMGIGKTTVCRQLKKELQNSVFLDGDWCWDSDPFQVTEDTKAMVLDNIRYLLNNFIHCPAYENIIFCWVMHEQAIIDNIVQHIDTECCRVEPISLICDVHTLIKRLEKDIDDGLRDREVLDRSVKRISCYQQLKTRKIDTSEKQIQDIVREIIERQECIC